MTFLTTIRIAGATALVAVALAACTVVEDGPRRPPPGAGGPGGPQMCTREYDPVCAERGRDRRTFGNACSARAEGYRIVQGGECRRGGGGSGGGGWDGRPGGGGGSGWDGRPGGGGGGAGRPGGGRPPVACTREYAPVCARRRGDTRTFPNGCEAEAAGYRIVGRGAC